MNKKLLLVCAALISGCAMVRQSDLDAWVGMPVEALDTHSFFLTLPMVRTVSSSGIEIRNYANGMDVSQCTASGTGTVRGKTLTSLAFSNCTSSRVGCNNIFYIKNGKVVEYAPTGQCKTNETVRPQRRYLDLQQPN